MSAAFVEWVYKCRKEQLLSYQVKVAERVHLHQLTAWTVAVGVVLRRGWSAAPVALPLEIKKNILGYLSEGDLDLSQCVLTAASTRQRTDAAKALVEKELKEVEIPKFIATIIKSRVQKAADKGKQSVTVSLNDHNFLPIQREVSVLGKPQGSMLRQMLQRQGFKVEMKDDMIEVGVGPNKRMRKRGVTFTIRW